MKKAHRTIIFILIGGFITSCVRVDVCRWAVTPTLDNIFYNHGFNYPPLNVPKEDQPPGSSIIQTRIVSTDKVVDLSITHLTIPGQKLALVYCGGNGFRQGSLAKPLFNAFSPTPNMLIFDYPGYGQSGGDATANDFNQATKLLSEHIAQWQQEQNHTRIIFWGQSFGGTICARLAGNHSGPSTLVLETTYNDLDSLASSRAGIFKHFVKIKIDSEAPNFSIDRSLETYAGSITILKSSNDPITPPEESDKLAQLLRTKGKSVNLINMGAVDHKEILFQPCLAAKILARMRPQMENLTTNIQNCKQ